MVPSLQCLTNTSLGGHGGDVVIYADEGKDTLLELHEKCRYNAKRGGNVDAMGVLTSQSRDGLAAPTLRIPVPRFAQLLNANVGSLLADLAQPGDEVLVARGGQGGLLEMPEHGRKKLMSLTTNIIRDESDKVLILGQPGEEVSLELILRVVADAGLVGASKCRQVNTSAAITLAKPDIADYPFTTLMPNLGRPDGDPALGAGLGRNLLRHLRRTLVLVHVVDTSTGDPLNDYRTVRDELRMYNPNYLERPYIVLNKIDLPEARNKLPHLTEEILKIGSDIVHSELEMSSRDELESFPLKVIWVQQFLVMIKWIKELRTIPGQLLKGIQVNEMLKEIRAAQRKCRDLSEALELNIDPSFKHIPWDPEEEKTFGSDNDKSKNSKSSMAALAHSNTQIEVPLLVDVPLSALDRSYQNVVKSHALEDGLNMGLLVSNAAIG
ncbi:putative GTP-binding protein OBGC2 [Hibiscus syriacus]|uniref:GTP-binding protein OBGC2 n=1 Tax=Hibiscus syriacus TaxID=106335 RepID=A0A6A3ATD2_HIBSY|nr:putative GTP-binding protein OBGC2 [Hibiscus syriacus]